MQSSCLKFDEFLAENIRSQLINFQRTRTFRFQYFLMRMFLTFNEDNLQLPKMAITDEINKYYCKFMNFLMAPVYNVFFQENLPKVLPEMKELLELSPERRVGDWFLSEHNTVIRVYRFSHQPYILLAFLRVRVFALELIRKG